MEYMGNQKTVSVAVVTYNSSKTVLETLESIKQQKYANIELIISDDASVDDTISVCKEWLTENGQRFVRFNLLTVEKNTGVPANSNRAIKECKGSWLKLIAGDDILLETCIADFVEYMTLHPEVKVTFSRCRPFKIVNGEKRFLQEIPSTDQKRYYTLSTDLQRICHYYWQLPFPGPVVFFKKDLFDTYSFNEKYDGLEDYPFYMQLLEDGIHIDFMDKVTVLWRRGESLSSSKKYMKNPRLQRSKDMYFLDHQYNYLKENYPEIFKYRMAQHFIANFMITFLRNRPTLFNRIILKGVHLWLRKEEHYNLDEVINKYSKKVAIE